MVRHEIPNHLGVEDKLLGPLATRDALYLLIGASAAYGIWTNTTLASGVRAPFAGVVVLVAVTFALVKIRGRALEGWLFAVLTYSIQPRRAIWASHPTHPARVHQSPAPRRRHYQLRMRWRAHPTSGTLIR